jgi:hypothetical protein
MPSAPDRSRRKMKKPGMNRAFCQSGMRLGWGHDDGAFFFSRPDAAQQECCEPGFTLLCMGLFSRFFVQALPCTAEGTVCRVRDTRSLVPRIDPVPTHQALAEALRLQRLRPAAPRPARRRMEPQRGARLGRRPPVRLLVRLTPRVHQVTRSVPMLRQADQR